MSFFAPWFLFGLAAIAIPIILHMIDRQRALEIPFSTLRFVRLSMQRTRRRKYVDDMALLLLRVLAMGLIALALASPVLSGLRWLAGGGSSRALVLIVDNSASMATMDQGQSRLERAKAYGGEILDQLREGDRVALLFSCGPALPEIGQLLHTQETVRQALLQVQPGFERADLAARLRDADKLLFESDAIRKEIVILTDNQANSWESLKLEKETPSGSNEDYPILIVQTNGESIPNVGLRALRLDGPAPVVGVPMTVSAELINSSSMPQQRNLELHVNGVQEARSPTLTIPAESSIRHDFQFTTQRGGLNRGELVLTGEDGNPQDNRLFFSLRIDHRIRVAVIKSRRLDLPQAEESFYLERALAPITGEGWAIQTTTFTLEDIPNKTLFDYAVIFAVNLPTLEASLAARLLEYATHGGHLFWVAGPNVQPEAINELNRTFENRLYPASFGPLKDTTRNGQNSRRIGSLESTHPALAPLCEPASLYQSVLVHKFYPLNTDQFGGATVLARLDDGQPLLVERKIGTGSILLLATSTHSDWTNLPIKPIFMPLLARLCFHLAGVVTDKSQAVCGTPISIPLTSPERPIAIEIIRPSGETLRATENEASTKIFRYSETHEIGIYLLREGEGAAARNHAFAVNPNSEEVDAKILSGAELKARFGNRQVAVLERPEDLSSTLRKLKEGTNLRDYLLWILLGILVGETILSNQLARRKAEDDVPEARALKTRKPPMTARMANPFDAA